MTVFQYDRTFEGVLTCVFEAYSGKLFPERLIGYGEPTPMFTENIRRIMTCPKKAARVWKGMEKKVLKRAVNMLFHVWLSELSGSDELLFRAICKIFDSEHAPTTDFSDRDMLEVHQIALKVSREAERTRQFVRFQKAGDGTYFASVEPDHNTLPLSLSYFKDRFADQRWLIYDTKRNYGYYYDLQKVTEIILPEGVLTDGHLNEKLIAEGEKDFQRLWRSYFKSLAIRERINPKLQRQHMPRRYWKYMPEMQ